MAYFDDIDSAIRFIKNFRSPFRSYIFDSYTKIHIHKEDFWKFENKDINWQKEGF